jgi:hypothetical protein
VYVPRGPIIGPLAVNPTLRDTWVPSGGYASVTLGWPWVVGLALAVVGGVADTVDAGTELACEEDAEGDPPAV